MEPIRALIIDDDRDTADLFRTVLSLVGFECHAVYTAKAAFAYLAANEPDIVLLDMRLGLEMNGNDILYQIRSNPRFDKMRVIIITAYPGMLDQVDNLADLTLLKPVEVEDLEKLASRLTHLRPKSHLFRDPLTNLYSISFFLTRLEHAYERAKRCPQFTFMTAAIQFDYDPVMLAKIQGEGKLQQLMKAIAERLRGDFRPTDTFGYLSEGRVIALFEDLKQPTDIPIVVGRLEKTFTEDILAGGAAVQVTPVFGVVRIDPALQKVDEIMADVINKLDENCAARALSRAA